MFRFDQNFMSDRDSSVSHSTQVALLVAPYALQILWRRIAYQSLNLSWRMRKITFR
jgi:hypothetical protein